MSLEQDDGMARAEAILADDEATQAERKRLDEVTELGGQVVEALKTCFDPEIPVNIYDMGLIYKVDIEDDNTVLIDMTLTSPNCPVAESMPGEVEIRVLSVPGVRDAEVKLVWDPPWGPDKMTDEARLELGML